MLFRLPGAKRVGEAFARQNPLFFGLVSLTPGFSPVIAPTAVKLSRFNGLAYFQILNFTEF